MTAVEHPAPELLRGTARRLLADREAKPGMTDVRRHLQHELRGRCDIGALTRDDLERTTMDRVDGRWAAGGRRDLGETEQWAAFLLWCAADIERTEGGEAR